MSIGWKHNKVEVIFIIHRFASCTPTEMNKVF
jgi:hypothetical protein